MSSDKSSLNWYALRVITGKEKKIQSYLLREIARNKWSEYAPEIIVPVEKVYHFRKSGGKSKKVVVERSFFPGYLIICADFSISDVLNCILYANGVLGFPNMAHKSLLIKPSPIPPKDVKQILDRMKNSDQEDIKEEFSYKIGDSVKIKEGPFKDFVGAVGEVFEEKKKMNVMVKIFGRNTPLEVNYSQVTRGI